jgi:hypothetical protein
MPLRNRTNLSVEAVKPVAGANNRARQGPATSEDPTFTALEEPIQVAAGDDYAQLRQLVRQAGLLEKQPAYYAHKFVLTLTLLGVGFTVLALVDTLWLQLLDAVLLAVVWSQLAFLGHDAGHRQIFKSARRNDIVGLGIAFCLGMVRTWWVDKHNRHHSFPNELGKDPDVDIPVLAFDEKDALRKKMTLSFYSKVPGLPIYRHAQHGGICGFASRRHPIHVSEKTEVPGGRAAHNDRPFRGVPGAGVLPAQPMACGHIHRGAPGAFWALHGRRLRSQPQGYADDK